MSDEKFSWIQLTPLEIERLWNYTKLNGYKDNIVIVKGYDNGVGSNIGILTQFKFFSNKDHFKKKTYELRKFPEDVFDITDFHSW